MKEKSAPYYLLISGQLIKLTFDQAYQLRAHNEMYISKKGFIIPVWQKPSKPRHNDFNPRYIIMDETLTDLETGEKLEIHLY